MNAPIVVQILRFGFLALLWIFIFATLRVVRADLAGAGAARLPMPTRPAASPRPRPKRRGKALTHLLVTEGGLAGTRIRLGGAPVMLGRANDSTLVLTDDYASTRHARSSAGTASGSSRTWAPPTAPIWAAQGRRPDPVPLGVPVRIGKTVLELRRSRWRDLSSGTPCAPTSGWSATTTRTRSTPVRGCSRSPTAWAATRPVRSPASRHRCAGAASTRTARSTTCIAHAARRRRGGERQPARRGGAAQEPRGHGHHAHRAALRRLPGRPGARRGLARLPAAQRPAHPDHPRRHVRPVPGRLGPAHRGRGQPPAQLGDPARAQRHARSSRTSRSARPALGDRYLLCTDGLSDVVSAGDAAGDAADRGPAGVAPTGWSSSRCAAAARTTSP